MTDDGLRLRWATDWRGDGRELFHVTLHTRSVMAADVRIVPRGVARSLSRGGTRNPSLPNGQRSAVSEQRLPPRRRPGVHPRWERA